MSWSLKFMAVSVAAAVAHVDSLKYLNAPARAHLKDTIGALTDFPGYGVLVDSCGHFNDPTDGSSGTGSAKTEVVQLMLAQEPAPVVVEEPAPVVVEEPAPPAIPEAAANGSDGLFE